MKQLTKTYRLRISENDKMLLNELKRLKVKPTTFIRAAFREKIQNDMPDLLKKEQDRLSKAECPF